MRFRGGGTNLQRGVVQGELRNGAGLQAIEFERVEATTPPAKFERQAFRNGESSKDILGVFQGSKTGKRRGHG